MYCHLVGRHSSTLQCCHNRLSRLTNRCSGKNQIDIRYIIIQNFHKTLALQIKYMSGSRSREYYFIVQSGKVVIGNIQFHFYRFLVGRNDYDRRKIDKPIRMVRTQPYFQRPRDIPFPFKRHRHHSSLLYFGFLHRHLQIWMFIIFDPYLFFQLQIGVSRNSHNYKRIRIGNLIVYYFYLKISTGFSFRDRYLLRHLQTRLTFVCKRKYFLLPS